MPAELMARAPAKINLALDVLGRRHDGYHELDTIFVELDLADDLTWIEADHPGVDVAGPAGDRVPGGDANLAWRAVLLAGAEVGRKPEVRIAICKRIPAAAGLGGGSSDAAAALRLAASAWSLPPGTIERIALQLGSDVPYFLRGGVARGRGRGEVLEPLPGMPRHAVVLFPPPPEMPVPPAKTAAVFSAFQELALPPSGATDIIASRLASGSILSTVDLAGANRLERAALRVMPGLAEYRQRIEAAIGAPVALTGAGPTWFWIGAPKEGVGVFERAHAAGIRAILAETAEP